MGLAVFFFLEDNEASWQVVYCSLLLNIETKWKKIYIVYVIKVTRHFLPIPPPSINKPRTATVTPTYKIPIKNIFTIKCDSFYRII